METVKLGVVGVGGRGGSLLRLLMEMEEVEVACIADVSRERVEALSSEYGIPGFTSHQELMDSGKVEAVVIAAPHPFHAPIAVDAARRGLHILCEKPIAVRVSEADRMVSEARRAGVVLGVMFNQRTAAAHSQAKALLDAGEIGEVYDVEMISTKWYRRQAYYDSGSWRGTWKGEGGGILANQAPHDLDLLVWLGGVPRAAQASLKSRIHRIETENTVNVILDYSDVKTGYFRATTTDPLGKATIEISGEKGRLVIEDGKREGAKLRLCRYERPLSEHILKGSERRAPFHSEWEDVPLEGAGRNGSRDVILAFVRALRLGEPLVATGEDGVRALELANAIHLSGLTEQKVTLPVDRNAVDNLFTQLVESEIGLAGAR